MAQDLILDDNWADADMDNPEWKDEAAIVVPAEGVETRLDPMQRRLEEAKAAGPPFCVFLGNLPFSISEQEIREEFAEIEVRQGVIFFKFFLSLVKLRFWAKAEILTGSLSCLLI